MLTKQLYFEAERKLREITKILDLKFMVAILNITNIWIK